MSLIAIGSFKEVYIQEINQQLDNNAQMASALIKEINVSIPSLESRMVELGKSIRTRITIIDRDGKVLADSERDPETMVNHNDRLEIINARATGKGQAIRFSNTLSLDMIYLAIPLTPNAPADKIIRVALPLSQINHMTNQMYRTIGITFGILIIIAVLMGFWLTRKVTRPLNKVAAVAESIAKGDFSQQISIASNDEIGTLTKTINVMSDELRQKFSEIREKSNMLNTVLSTTSEGIIAFDDELKIIFANAAAGKLMDFTIEKAANTHLWETVRHEQLVKFVKNRQVGSMKGSASMDIVSPNARQLRLYYTPINALPDNFMLVIYDVTEQNRFEQLRKDFVANVSHELRTPLTFIKGYVETLKEGGMEDKQSAAEFLNIIDRNVKQLTNLVEDLLELSRLESSRPMGSIIRLKPTAINKLIERVIENYRPAIAGKQHIVTRNIDASIPETPLDPDLMSKAIGNLIDNAIKYTPSGGKIELKAEIELDKLKIECIDNGIGIPQEDLARVFERFYRVDKSRSREMGGTGLGLSIVKHIIQLHQGEVSVQSEINKGSTFTIKLPLN